MSTPRPAPDDKLWMTRKYISMACHGGTAAGTTLKPDCAACPGTIHAGNRADRPVPCSHECHQTPEARAAARATRISKRR